MLSDGTPPWERRPPSPLALRILLPALLVALAGPPALAQDVGNPQDPEASGGSVETAAEAPAGAEPDAEAQKAPVELDAAQLEEALDAAEPQADDDIEEIIVTGIRREDLLQDVPISITSFNAAEIKALRIQNISDLAEYTPNLEINTAFAASNPTLFIRGIGLKDYNANAAGAVAVYQDGVNINSPAIQLFQLFDVSSVEVLRGPQGSLNGRNATAGAIMVNSVLPDGEFAVNSSFTYGNYNNIQAEGGVTFPLIEDMLSARVAFTVNFRDGVTDNECAGWQPEAHGFSKIDPGTITQTYNDLLPHNQKVEILDRRDNPLDEFVYLNTEESQRQGPQGLKNIAKLGRLNEEIVVNGQTYPVGTVVGRQEELFTRSEVDSVCILNSPGEVVTFAGADLMDDDGPVWGAEGDFLKNNVPALADFQGLEGRINDVANWAARGITRLQPLEGMDWILNFHGGQNRSDSRHLQMLGADAKQFGGFFEDTEGEFSEAKAARLTGLEGTVNVEGLDPKETTDVPPIVIFPGEGGSDPLKGWYNRDGTEFLDAWGGSLRGYWDVGPLVVTSLTGYEWYDRLVEDEGDANAGDVFPADWSDSAWQVSQELRTEGEGERYRWGAGFFFLYEELDSLNIFPDTRKFRIVQQFDQKLWSVAPYASGRYQFTEDVSLQGGLRYNVEHKDFALESSAVGTDSGIEVPAINDEDSATWNGLTGDLTLSYAPFDRFLAAGEAARIDSLNFYAKYARGMKGGHFNAGLTIQGVKFDQSVDAVDPEFIHSVEIGFKSRWLEDRLLLNVAGFRYWYKDLQIFDINNGQGDLPLQQLLNSDARVLGVEVELQARPLPGLLVQSGFGWLDGRFKDFSVEKLILDQRNTPTPHVFDYDGNPLIASPRYNVNGIVQYEIPLFGALSGYGSIVPQYDFSWRSKVYLDPQKLDPISQPAYWLHNARLAYRTEDGRIEVAGWVRNFLDQRYKIDVFDVTREFDTILEVWGDPRTFGLTISYNW